MIIRKNMFSESRCPETLFGRHSLDLIESHIAILHLVTNGCSSKISHNRLNNKTEIGILWGKTIMV